MSRSEGTLVFGRNRDSERFLDRHCHLSKVGVFPSLDDFPNKILVEVQFLRESLCIVNCCFLHRCFSSFKGQFGLGCTDHGPIHA